MDTELDSFEPQDSDHENDRQNENENMQQDDGNDTSAQAQHAEQLEQEARRIENMMRSNAQQTSSIEHTSPNEPLSHPTPPSNTHQVSAFHPYLLPYYSRQRLYLSPRPFMEECLYAR